MASRLKGWEYLPNGLVKMMPVTGAQATPVTSGLIAVRLGYVRDAEHQRECLEGRSSPETIQLGLTLENAADLVKILTNSVNKVRAEMSSTGKPN